MPRPPMAGDWTDEQNDAIVADYFAMLADDIAGRAYGKAEHNRLMQATLGRSHGSIEYKHRNISAVLKGLGEDWIPGYRPAFNVQASLGNGWERTPFHITRNELEVAEANRDHWRLVRLWNFVREPRAFELQPPLEAHVSLMATSFQANLL